MKRFSRIALLCVAALSGVAAFAEGEISDLAGLATSVQTSVTSDIFTVATSALALFSIVIGIGFLVRWVRRVVKSS